MLRLFLPRRCAVRESPSLSRRAAARVEQQLVEKRSVFNQQQRRHAAGTNTASSKHQPKSRIWMCGLGVGIALAVGLKCRRDTTCDSCDERTERYDAAVKVSRELLERIKVGTEVGTEVGLFLPVFDGPTCRCTHCLTWVTSVCVCCQAEVGAPGLVVGVSVDGVQVWCEGWLPAKSTLKVLCILFFNDYKTTVTSLG